MKKIGSASSISRRDLLKAMGTSMLGTALAACSTPPTPAATTESKPAQPATTPAPQKATEITYQSWINTPDFIEEEVKIFNQAQSKVAVKLEVIPVADYETKMTTLAAGGSLGDCYFNRIFGTLFPFASGGVHMPLDNLIKGDSTISVNDFFPASIQLSTWNGKMVVLPAGGHPGMSTMFVNLDLYQKGNIPLPKWEWQYEKEWLEAVLKSKETISAGSSEKRFGYQFTYQAQDALLFIRSFGGDWIDSATRAKATIDTEKTRAGLSFMRDLVNKHKVTPKPEEVVANMFVNGLTASYSAIVSSGAVFKTAIGDKFKWSAFPMPAGPGGVRGTFIGNDAYSIYNKSKNADAAFAWGKWLVWNKDAIKRAMAVGRQPSMLKKMWEEAPISTDPNYEQAKKWMEIATAWTVPHNARVTEFNQAFVAGLQAVINEANNFDAEIKKLNSAIQAVLDKPAL